MADAPTPRSFVCDAAAMEEAASTPAPFAALAAAMPPLTRALLLADAAPDAVPLGGLLAELGLDARRHLAGGGARVLHARAALPPAACAALRAAVDARAGHAPDSVDGLDDWQLDLRSAQELAALVGAEAARRLAALPRDFARHPARRAALAGASPRAVDDDDGDDGGDDGDGGGGGSGGGGGDAAIAGLQLRQAFVRRYSATERPWFSFHTDRAPLTANVALTADDECGGGRLLAVCGGRVRELARREGDATVHPAALLHGVGCVRAFGARYSLLLFWGERDGGSATRAQTGAAGGGRGGWEAEGDGEAEADGRCV
jgi:hypothetical protein